MWCMIGQKDQRNQHERGYPFTQSLETGYFLEIGIWDGNWIVGMRKLDRITFLQYGRY